LAGIIGGFLSGLLGIGGALVFIPIITHVIAPFLLGAEAIPYILANSFCIVFIAGAAASFKQYKLGNYYPQQSIYTAIPAAFCSLIVAAVVKYYSTYNGDELIQFFKFIFLLLLVFIFFNTLFTNRKKAFFGMPNQIANKKFVYTGIGVGFISGITGLGGGVLMLPIFSQFFRLKYSIATAISSLVIPLFTLPSLIYYAYLTPTETIYPSMQLGYICLPIVLPTIPFIILCSQLGVKLNHRFPVWILNAIFALIILINIYKIIFL